MGVRGLETFQQNEVPNGVISINILNEINRRREELPDEPIVLVFQMVDILYNIFANLSTTEIMCGPAFKKIHKIFEERIRELADSGVDLHFFVNEPAQHKDFVTWKRNESEQYSHRTALIDRIDANVAIETIGKIDKQPGATAALNDLITICQKYGTVNVRANTKFIAEVVEYSNKINAMAIVGNNSHFLIFDGNWRYWSCRGIAFMNRSWDTVEFDRNELLKYVGLTRLQMPMFATAVGNEFIGSKMLISFHTKMKDNKFLAVAKWVNHIPNTPTKEEQRNILLDLFGSSSPQNFDMVRESLLFYSKKPQVIEQTDALLTSAASINATYYNALKGTPIRVKAPTFYDLRRTDFLPYFDIILPILRRQIGFVRKHRHDSEYEQVLQLRLSHCEPIRSKPVIPEYPVAEIPDLMELSFNRNNDYFNGVRFKLLKWMVFGRDIDRQFSIEQIPNGFMVTVVTCMYLCKLQQLSTAEVNAILLTTQLIHKDADYAKNLDDLTTVSSRDIMTSHLYIYVHNLIVKCFLFLGLYDFVDYLSFDGVYYVHWVNKIKTGGCAGTLSQIENLTQFLRYVTESENNI